MTFCSVIATEYLSKPRIFLISAIFSPIIHTCKWREVFLRLIRDLPLNFSFSNRDKWCNKWLKLK